MTIIKSYKNGNCSVALHSDGTKVRSWWGAAKPLFPESIDLKITDQCDRMCAWCHEDSLPDGRHADVGYIRKALRVLPQGVEIAIGGGDPFCHPRLPDLLQWLKRRGLIANITVSGAHLARYEDQIRAYRKAGWIYGLGISFYAPMRRLKNLHDSRTVVHFIAGVHHPKQILALPKTWAVLVLGYKLHGRGIAHSNFVNVSDSISAWRFWIGAILRTRRRVAFDSLALEQIGVSKWLSKDTWESRYMGDDGRFTMYLDATKRQYAVSSVSLPRPAGDKSVTAMFQSLQGECRCRA